LAAHMSRKTRSESRTNEQRLRCVAKLFVYIFVCDDCGKRWSKKYADDHGESQARSSIRHRCSRKLVSQ